MTRPDKNKQSSTKQETVPIIFIFMKFLLPILLFFVTTLHSQNYCVTDEYNKDRIENRSSNTPTDIEVDLDTKYRINVVFHVIYNDSIDKNMYLDNEDVDYLIECLNRDFNLLNSDTSTLTDTLKRLPASMNIEFVLASVDPDGNPTNGITRTETDVSFFTFYNDGAKFDSLGGKTAWDTKRYLNIWSCKISNGVLGYSQFPDGNEETDGVVVHYDIMRENPTLYPKYNKGRVLAHEIGHWLNLRHPWGNGWGCGNNGVTDIPTQNGPNYNCPDTTFSLCNGDTTRDVVKHYMDYCGDSCMVMFTKGQVYNGRISLLVHRQDMIEEVIVEPEPILPISEREYKVYPTLNDGRFYLEFNFVPEKMGVIVIYDVNRKIVGKQEMMLDKKISFDLSHYSSGTYLIVVRSEEVINTTKRIVITNKSLHRIEKELEDDYIDYNEYEY